VVSLNQTDENRVNKVARKSLVLREIDLKMNNEFEDIIKKQENIEKDVKETNTTEEYTESISSLKKSPIFVKK